MTNSKSRTENSGIKSSNFDEKASLPATTKFWRIADPCKKDSKVEHEDVVALDGKSEPRQDNNHRSTPENEHRSEENKDSGTRNKILAQTFTTKDRIIETNTSKPFCQNCSGDDNNNIQLVQDRSKNTRDLIKMKLLDRPKIKTEKQNLNGSRKMQGEKITNRLHKKSHQAVEKATHKDNCKNSEKPNLDVDRQIVEQVTRKKETKNSKQKKSSTARTKERDRKLAKQLQNKDDQARQKASLARGHETMMSTSVGKAVLAVERIFQLVEAMNTKNGYIDLELQPVAKDDMVIYAERFLAKQEEFKRKRISTKVDIGFHYTKLANMNGIRTNGLMTREDQMKNNIDVTTKKPTFGDGIYTANNPSSFMKYGRVGLIVARLQGKTVCVPKSLTKKPRKRGNTIIGNKSVKSQWKWPKSDPLDEVVLQTSSQCLPLVRYNKKPLCKSPQECNPEAYIRFIADALTVVLHELFNDRETPAKWKRIWNPFTSRDR